MTTDTTTLSLRRGLVLFALEANYPLALLGRALEERVLPFYGGASAASGQAFARDLEYLAEKRLIDRTEAELDGRRLVSWRLTASGLDVVTGVSQVPGITIERAR